MTTSHFMDELERDLGQAARLRLMLNAGGQVRYVPGPAHAAGSALAQEVGADIAQWLAARFGGETVTFPSRRGAETEERAAQLRAAVLDAGLTDPDQSANDIAATFGVSVRRVRQIRAELRDDLPEAPLPLFRDL